MNGPGKGPITSSSHLPGGEGERRAEDDHDESEQHDSDQRQTRGWSRDDDAGIEKGSRDRAVNGSPRGEG